MPQSNTEPNAELLDLDISRVALCNQGANTRAHIKLTKGKENTQMPNYKTYDELIAAMEPEATALIKSHVDELLKAKETELNKSNTLLQAKEEELKKAQEQLDASKATKTPEDVAKGTKDPKEPTEEDMYKSLPPKLREQFEKQQQQIAELIKSNQLTEANRRFELVKSIPYEEPKLKEILKTVSPEVFEVLKAASAAIDKSTLTDGEGSDAAGSMSKSNSAQDAYDKLDTIAKSLATTQKITYEAAFTQACTDNAELYTQYVKGV